MVVVLFVLFTAQSPRDAGCTEWHDCRQQALAAADSGDYERFHDLAWRAVQTGPRQDAALMYLLARAQALSGRPHDALVMLQRLADMGVTTDAATDDDFARTRQLPGWPDVLAKIERITNPNASLRSAPAAAPPAAAPAPAAAPPSAPPAPAPSPAPAAEAVRFSSQRFEPTGLAYDAVSERFVVGDRVGHRLIVVDKATNRANDFVRAESAGFQDVAALEIDPKRGDLWVASTAPDQGGSLHKLQLISGRALKSFPVPDGLKPVALVDIAVTAGGTVLVLDGAGKQLLALRPGGAALERVARFDADGPVAVATGGDESLAYVAHREGVLRVDLRAKTATRLTAAKSISLAHLERIRSTRHGLIAIRADDDGSRHIVRLDLNSSGRAVTKATTLDAAVPASKMVLTVVGDDLVYLTEPAAAEFVAYRVPLR